MAEEAVVVVFDFDRTLIDGDSDNWVVTEMGLTQLFRELRSTMPWISLMNRMMMELHSKGKTVEDIEECLRRMPLHPRVIESIRAAHGYGCDLRIISDANQFFIETILKRHGLLGCFSEIVTNPAFVDAEGRLNIVPFHDSASSPHGCNLCPSNMCKGLVLKRIQAADSEFMKRRYVYLGDGRGDYCPCLRLGTRDFVMPRKSFPLWNLIFNDQMLIKAVIHEWSDREELAGVLLDIIDRILTDENTRTGLMALPDNGGKTTQVSYP
ncbi:thiamine phosphate phosphatase-like protein [Syzygium oleosum]|uniref:thiamine phosphate phosphatase-like protein n=1 Tax=Syzygium oleosum TaxID=219896 RepID=UPI0024BA88B8|nr:thiamine phosphate phosphatase-like protein [Syzygium oleosum]